jgi:methionyl aminopeptidase
MDQEELDNYRKSGKIASEVREWSKSLIKEGAGILDIANSIELKIIELGGEVAFPANVCINDVTAHYTPKFNDKTVISENDVVKIDIGAHVDGFIADTAYTIDLSGKYGKMLEANEKALDNIIKLIKPGVQLTDIGKTSQKTISDAGFKVIENLTGHEINQYTLHAGLSIPNIPIAYEKKIEEGMVLAIEPFATDGCGKVIESKHVEIFSLFEKKPVRVREARSLIDEVEKREGLPFAERWFLHEESKMTPVKLQLILQDLVKRKILKQYPVLHEKEGGTVSQFEHTIIVTGNGCEVTTK